MDTTTVAAIVPGAMDPVFGEVTAVFAKKAGEYAIYRTDARVLIQYADQTALETAQRTAIAPLGPLRSEINALIDGWRRSDRDHIRGKVSGLDRRTADALVIALEGDRPGAVLELNKVRNAIIDDRTAFARFVYLIAALAVALVVSLVVAGLAAAPIGLVGRPGCSDVFTAILGGLSGSFFSIAIGLSKRTILPNAIGSDNLLDAVLRMLIGIISAGILICLMRGGFGVTFQFATPPKGTAADLIQAVPWMQLVAIGFLAGFSERLVPDLLEQAGQAVQATDLPRATPIPTATPPTAPDLQAIKAAGAEPIAEPHGDCCSDVPLADGDATADAALPAATGGMK